MTSYFVFTHSSRKIWIVQIQFFGYLLYTSNEKSGCAEFWCYLRNAMYILKLTYQKTKQKKKKITNINVN